MSVDDLMDRARPLAAGGVPSKNAIQKNLRVSWDRAVAVHERLSREAAEAARNRAGQRRMKLRQGGIREGSVRRMRAPRTALPSVPVSPVVEQPAAVPFPPIKLGPGDVPAPPLGLFHGPSVPPLPRPVAAPVPADAGRASEESVASAAGPAGTSSVVASKRAATWPVVLLAMPAFVAIWSGWVDLGRLTGFGVVHPLPGIADEVALNTAITLPIGLETYAAYALYVWLSGAVPARARQFARRSAVGALMLGAAGQVAYHLMIAAGMARAPWWITTVVACLPVAVLGMGAALRHLVHAGEVK